MKCENGRHAYCGGEARVHFPTIRLATPLEDPPRCVRVTRSRPPRAKSAGRPGCAHPQEPRRQPSVGHEEELVVVHPDGHVGRHAALDGLQRTELGSKLEGTAFWLLDAWLDRAQLGHARVRSRAQQRSGSRAQQRPHRETHTKTVHGQKGHEHRQTALAHGSATFRQAIPSPPPIWVTDR